ncbi:MAG: hypothetical protein WDN04_23980 [Rhodospirillales bacterium]
MRPTARDLAAHQQHVGVREFFAGAGEDRRALYQRRRRGSRFVSRRISCVGRGRRRRRIGLFIDLGRAGAQQ